MERHTYLIFLFDRGDQEGPPRRRPAAVLGAPGPALPPPPPGRRPPNGAEPLLPYPVNVPNWEDTSNPHRYPTPSSQVFLLPYIPPHANQGLE